MNAAEFTRQRARIERRARNRAAFLRRGMERLVRESGAKPVAAGGKLLAYELPDGSMACLKWRYRDEEAAQLELVRVAKHDQHHKAPVRAYRCHLCWGWHLTSRA